MSKTNVRSGEWSFPDAPLRGVYGLNDVYERIGSWDDFAPWLSRIERFSERQLHGIANEIPCEWYGERDELQRLLDCLLDRRSMVRQLIEDFRKIEKLAHTVKEKMKGPY